MKNKIIFISIFILAMAACSDSKITQPRNGDILFHSSKSIQSKAIEVATGSEYTHMGIVVIQKGKVFVYEAGQIVHLTPLNVWIKRGIDDKYVVKRLKNADKVLTGKVELDMMKAGSLFNGKKYDMKFQWSDDKIYCSELVWKIYQRGAGISLCSTKKFNDFNIKDKVVQNLIKKRYGSEVNLNEKVVAPYDIYKSDKLITVRYE